MSEWLKTLLGVEDKEIPRDAVTSFEFANLPHGSAGLLLLLLAVALVAGVFWVYRREGSAASGVKLSLAALRGLVLAAAFVLVLEPILAVDQVQHIDKGVVVLLDESLSMAVKDPYRKEADRLALSDRFRVEPRELARYELVNEALASSGLIARLARQNQVHVFRFNEGAVPHAVVARSDGTTPTPPIPPLELGNGPEAEQRRKRAARGTNLAGAIRQAVEQVGSERIAAIVVVSDGRVTLGPPPEDVAIFLKNKALRLHTVAVGESIAPGNLRALALAGPDQIFLKDPAVLDARVSARNYGVTSVVLERRYPDDGEEWSEIESKDVSFIDDDKPVDLKFRDHPPRVGTVEYRIRIPIEPDESNKEDNTKTFVTRVIEEKAMVLLVSGAPAYEYYAIKNVLLRDRTITVACYLQSADPEFPQDGNDISLTELPASEKDLFKYDVVLLHDPNGDLFPPDWPALLKRFVSEHRGGLGFIAGNKHTLSLLRSGVAENDLTALLPVVLDLDRADMPGIGIGYGAYFSTPWRMEPEPEAFTHPVTRFHADARAAKDLIWDRLPPFYWFFPVLRAKPGATVLARHDDPRETVAGYGRRPTLAVHRYGAGNVLFLAADETHRWRSVAEPIFDRFWVQTVRFLLEGRHAGAKRRFRIFTDRELLDLGDAVQLSAEVFDENYSPLAAERVTVRLSGPNGLAEEVTLLAVEGKQGHFSGTYAPPEVGDYELRAADEAFRPKEGADTPAATFRVTLPDREMGDTRADRTLLKDLADRTGGLAVPLEDIQRVGDPKLIPPLSEKVVTQGRPVPLWDTWTTIVVMLSLLCAEWILRKVFRMV